MTWGNFRREDFISQGRAPSTVEFEAAVIGAGPAGLAAAIELHRAGVKTVIVDMNPLPGGQYYKYQAGPSQAKTSHINEDPIKTFFKTHLTYLPQTTVWGIFPHPGSFLVCLDGPTENPNRIHARKVILAAGSYEKPHPFPGWTLPGVITAGAARTIIKTNGSFPGDQVVLCGVGPHLLILAREMLERGIHLKAVVESCPFPRLDISDAFTLMRHPALSLQVLNSFLVLNKFRVPVYWNWQIEKAIGEDTLNALQIFNKQDPTEKKTIVVDTVCTGYGFLPSNQLAIQAGCDFISSPDDGILLPKVNENLESSLPGFFIAGDCGGIAGRNAAQWSGRLSALEVVSQLGYPCDQSRKNYYKKKLSLETDLWNRTRTLFLDSPGWLKELPDNTILCRCEDITFKDVRQAVRKGAESPNSIKQITRAGMGLCQGRQCGVLITRLIAELLEEDPSNVGTLAPGAPVFPVRLGELIENDTGGTPEMDKVF